MEPVPSAPPAPSVSPAESPFQSIVLYRRPTVSLLVLFSGVTVHYLLTHYPFIWLHASVALLALAALAVLSLLKKQSTQGVQGERAQQIETLAHSIAAQMIPFLPFYNSMMEKARRALSFNDLVFSLQVFGGLFFLWIFSRAICLKCVVFMVFIYYMSIPFLMARFPEQTDRLYALVMGYIHNALQFVAPYLHKAREEAAKYIPALAAPAPSAPAHSGTPISE
eukprot:GAFH01003536.1.p1 GENE.GAFH01003536.1~~GAFH01003536.1.p1  ORF type:complete len:235 (-),score=38.42 GAFH01003536.1:225-893(-)